ncbi:hypothetical protein CERZMDRAFT_87865 [Cercospora zeae-maydis SCOH1-5]|uniref:Uncharacterized protein n=1 Tax=Cercospora zeae-maydis SCOH1-5 TaxID=717836 RepID=A0A6A6F2Y9_9PEZI|nr:hypothetical protein CERZMDRAFT_87865 [Cercospora zeae-maydis SCOH1-5]
MSTTTSRLSLKSGMLEESQYVVTCRPKTVLKRGVLHMQNLRGGADLSLSRALSSRRNICDFDASEKCIRLDYLVGFWRNQLYVILSRSGSELANGNRTSDLDSSDKEFSAKTKRRRKTQAAALGAKAVRRKCPSRAFVPSARSVSRNLFNKLSSRSRDHFSRDIAPSTPKTIRFFSKSTHSSMAVLFGNAPHSSKSRRYFSIEALRGPGRFAADLAVTVEGSEKNCGGRVKPIASSTSLARSGMAALSANEAYNTGSSSISSIVGFEVDRSCRMRPALRKGAPIL